MPQLTVQQLFDVKRDKLRLEWITGKDGGTRALTGDMLKRSGIAIIGHLNLIHPHRFKVLGALEVDYLNKLEPVELTSALRYIFSGENTAALFITNGLPVPESLISGARDSGTPLFVTPE
ncbi:MAG: HPr kinase/phosphorylase, partial [Burkholderiales bacterium]